VNDAYSGSGMGIKRKGTSTISAIYTTQYDYLPGVGGALSCSGDSGGRTSSTLGGRCA